VNKIFLPDTLSQKFANTECCMIPNTLQRKAENICVNNSRYSTW